VEGISATSTSGSSVTQSSGGVAKEDSYSDRIHGFSGNAQASQLSSTGSFHTALVEQASQDTLVGDLVDRSATSHGDSPAVNDQEQALNIAQIEQLDFPALENSDAFTYFQTNSNNNNAAWDNLFNDPDLPSAVMGEGNDWLKDFSWDDVNDGPLTDSDFDFGAFDGV